MLTMLNYCLNNGDVLQELIQSDIENKEIESKADKCVYNFVRIALISKILAKNQLSDKLM